MPESVVVPEVVVSVIAPARPLMVPPVEPTAPVRLPFCNVPPESVRVSIDCAKPPRSRMLLAVMPVAENALK